MNKALLQFALRNIKKYKKHYIFLSVTIFIVSLVFISYPTILENHYYALKQYNQEKYGIWYRMEHVIKDNQEILDTTELSSYLDHYNDNIEYSYIYHQGYYNDYQIARIEDKVYELCKLSIIQGNKPTKDNEIMISETLSKEENLKINDTLSLNLNNKNSNYKIVGIIQNSQDYVFPDIYTNVNDYTELYVVSNFDLKFYDTSFQYSNFNMNEYGYAGAEIINVEHILQSYTIQDFVIVIEMILLAVFIFIALISTSLKRRSKEFALLRGIGMTTKQMIIIVSEELLITNFISCIISFILSYPLTYLFALYYSKTLPFVYQFSLLSTMKYMFIIMILIYIIHLYPIYNCANICLTGTFEGKRFHYIHIRYRKLKKQSLSYIALRELKVNKKITLCLLLTFSMITSYYTCSINPYEYISYSKVIMGKLVDSNPYLLIIPSAFSIVFCYFLNQNYIFNNINDFVLLRLVGMTKRNMFKKQFYKALWCSLFIFCLQIFWWIGLMNYYQVIFIPIIPILCTTLFICLSYFIIYCLPILILLKKDMMSLLERSE